MKSLLVLFGTALLAGAASAQPKDFKPPVPQVAPALDKIAMTTFVCEPSPIPPGTTQVKLTVTVKNLTSGPQAVTINGPKLRVLRTLPQSVQGDVLELETTIVNLAPGATQSASQKVNVAPGVREYFARVDVDDTLHEPIVQRANNEKRLRLTIPQVSGQQAPPPGSTPPKETQLLDYQKAKRNGAQFADGVEGPTNCNHRTQLDVNGPDEAAMCGNFPRPPAGVQFQMGCGAYLTGGRATPEAFTNFRLRNGWRVKSYELVGVVKSNGADWQWRKTPGVGTDDPSMTMHVWANVREQVCNTVKVTIEGPAGTNPYQ
jgi:hypothetical protein